MARKSHRLRATPRGRHSRPSVNTEIEQTLIKHRDVAFSLTKARRFRDANAELEAAVRALGSAQKSTPVLRLSIPLLGKLYYQHGALLLRLHAFHAAAEALHQARACFRHLETKTLLRGPRKFRHFFRVSRVVVDLEMAYLRFRQRQYHQAEELLSQVLAAQFPLDIPCDRNRIHLGAHLILGWIDYANRRYEHAAERACRAQSFNIDFEGATSLATLAQARILIGAGKLADAYDLCVTDCRRLLHTVGLLSPDVPDVTTACPVESILSILAVVSAARLQSGKTEVLPEEREELAEFLIVLGVLQQRCGQTPLALRCLLVAGTLMPQAEERDIPEFEMLVRSLRQQALQDPRAFDVLERLLAHPDVRSRWEFLEATVEAIGSLPVGPALGAVTSLVSSLPPALPEDTVVLIAEIQRDLENELEVDGSLSRVVGLQVLSDVAVRFFLKSPFSPCQLNTVLDLIEQCVCTWKLEEVGMITLKDCTPETEQLTNILEEGCVRRFGLTSRRGLWCK